MNMVKTVLLATMFGAVAISQGFAEEFTKGTIKKVNNKTGKVSVRHEEIKNLEMPAMTMVFRTKDEAMLEKLQDGQKIEFVVERLNGKLTITKIKE